MDATTGAILAQKAPNRRWPPCGLAKLMTADLVYREIAHGNLRFRQTVPVSVAAWRTGGTRMFIAPGMTVTIGQLLHGLIIDAGNDAAVALAQLAAGTRQEFVSEMNATAARLGLTRTHYMNVTGIPKPGAYTTARDVAVLSREILLRHPAFLAISDRKQYVFDNIRQYNWNPALFQDPGVDGLGTGRTKAGGHCIAATAATGGRRLIAVVFGAPDWNAAAAAVRALLQYGESRYSDVLVTHSGTPIGSLFDPRYVPQCVSVGASRGIVATVPRAALAVLRRRLTLASPTARGVATGQTVGTVTVTADGRMVAVVPAVALGTARPAGLATRVVRLARKELAIPWKVFWLFFGRGLPAGRAARGRRAGNRCPAPDMPSHFRDQQAAENKEPVSRRMMTMPTGRDTSASFRSHA
jgi:D-alanyl-D-alanine carboxypeptidase (penicillin-binding protein 5/6)